MIIHIFSFENINRPQRRTEDGESLALVNDLFSDDACPGRKVPAKSTPMLKSISA